MYKKVLMLIYLFMHIYVTYTMHPEGAELDIFEHIKKDVKKFEMPSPGEELTEQQMKELEDVAYAKPVLEGLEQAPGFQEHISSNSKLAAEFKEVQKNIETILQEGEKPKGGKAAIERGLKKEVDLVSISREIGKLWERPLDIPDILKKKLHNFKEEWFKNEQLNTEKLEFPRQQERFIKEAAQLDPEVIKGNESTKAAFREFLNIMQEKAKDLTFGRLNQNIAYRLDFLEQHRDILKDEVKRESLITIFYDIMRTLSGDWTELDSKKLTPILERMSSNVDRCTKLLNTPDFKKEEVLSDPRVKYNIKDYIRQLAYYIEETPDDQIFKAGKKILEKLKKNNIADMKNWFWERGEKTEKEITEELKKRRDLIIVDLSEEKHRLQRLQQLKQEFQQKLKEGGDLRSNLNQRIDFLREHSEQFAFNIPKLAGDILNDILSMRLKELKEKKGFLAQKFAKKKAVELGEIQPDPMTRFNNFIEDQNLTLERKNMIGDNKKLQSHVTELKLLALEAKKREPFIEAYTILQQIEPYGVLHEKDLQILKVRGEKKFGITAAP